MSRFLSVIRYEYRMSIRRWGVWLAFGLLSIPYILPAFSALGDPAAVEPPPEDLWAFAGQTGFQLNLFMPVVAGIAVADRLVRDSRLNVAELLQSTSLRGWQYVLGKYFGSLLSMLTPALLLGLVMVAASVAFGAPVSILPMMLLAFLAIMVPAHAFVIAFSLACPVVIPLRVYQVLFTGYWFWGNYLNPQAFPTLSGTLLTPSGRFACEGLFGGCNWGGGEALSTPLDAVLNLGVLALAVAAVLYALGRYQAWRAAEA